MHWQSPGGASLSGLPRSTLLSRFNWTWLVLPLGFVLSGLAFHLANQVHEREARYRFEAVAGDARHRVEIELRAYAQVVYGLQALFSARPGLTHDEFDRYVATLDLASRYPGFESMNFARFVRAEERAAYERGVRESGRLPPALAQGFKIRAPADLPYHFVIDYVHSSVVPDAPTVGIDVTADPARRPAMAQQVENGLLTSSGLPITVVSKLLNTNVLPMRVAVFRPGVPIETAEDRWRALIGSVGAAFRVRLLFDNALGGAAEHLRLRVLDVGSSFEPPRDSTAHGRLVYDSRQADRYFTSEAVMVQDGRFEHRMEVEWATRRWILQFTGEEPVAALADFGWPWQVLAGGLVTTLLMFAWLQALARSREHAVAAQRAQSTFLANMSHELRTPLNAILGYAQILGFAKNLDERQAAGIRTIRMSGDHLLALIDDILDLARVEAGRLDLYPTFVELEKFLQDVSEIVRVRAEQKGLGFELTLDEDLPRAVQVDEKRLRQVLLNLLGNAVKFTDEGRVELRVRKLDTVRVGPGEVALLFEVEDSGIGMDRQQLAKLFQPFQQVGDAPRRRGGSGLGLAISRQLVRLMGSEVRVTSAPGQGSVFWFELRLAQDDAVASALPQNRPPIRYEGPRRKVLVVDDSAENREVLSDALRPLGFEVYQAVDGAQGLEQATALQPDAILMDNVMPVMNGLEAIRHLRGLSSFQQVPIIAISASATRDDIDRAMAAGATDFMAKPFRLDALVSLLEKHLGLKFTYE